MVRFKGDAIQVLIVPASAGPAAAVSAVALPLRHAVLVICLARRHILVSINLTVRSFSSQGSPSF